MGPPGARSDWSLMFLRDVHLIERVAHHPSFCVSSHECISAMHGRWIACPRHLFRTRIIHPGWHPIKAAIERLIGR